MPSLCGRIKYIVIGFAINRIISEETLVSVLLSLVPNDLSDILVIPLGTVPSRYADIVCFYAVADDEFPLYVEIAGNARVSHQQSCWMAHQFCRILDCIALVSPPIEPDNANPYVAWKITRDGPRYRVILNADARDSEPSLLILDDRYDPVPLDPSMRHICQLNGW
jgi:hypothetical protein